MSTRLKRPSFWRQLLFSASLIALQGYLGYSVVSGQFGIESQEQMQGEIDSVRHRSSLFTPQKLDPDIVSERARALLSMAQPDDLVIMVDPRTGKPIHSSYDALAADQLTGVIEDGID